MKFIYKLFRFETKETTEEEYNECYRSIDSQNVTPIAEIEMILQVERHNRVPSIYQEKVDTLKERQGRQKRRKRIGAGKRASTSKA
jgi:hypothetical protein